MRVFHMLGLDSNEIYGGVLILIGILAFVFSFVYWKLTESWKKNKGDKVRFFEIWRPSTIFGGTLFILLGVVFFLLGNWITF